MGTPADRIREIGPLWRWGGRGPITDPVDMEFKLGDDIQQRLTLVRLEAAASIHRALGDGYAKAAQLLSGKAKG